MAHWQFRIAGLQLALSAQPAGATLRLGYNGAAWQRLVAWIRARRARRAAAAGTPGGPAAPARAATELLQRVNALGWYHSIDLGGGVRTPGRFDHGPWLPQFRLPQRLDGQRVLDVATFDGYWAFEFERRGAAEVLALDLERPADLDWQPQRRARATPQELELRLGGGFALAHEVLRSRVQRVVCNVYDLGPARFGEFDLVHVGDLLLHLNNPVRALQNVASVCRGAAYISETVFPELDAAGFGPLMEYQGAADDLTWWRFSERALVQMARDAGFSSVQVLSRFAMGPRGHPPTMHHVVLKALR